jgi:hypothetical protein
VDAARAAYTNGLKRCGGCVPLWRAAARLEEAQGNVGRARALLEQVRGAACVCDVRVCGVCVCVKRGCHAKGGPRARVAPCTQTHTHTHTHTDTHTNPSRPHALVSCTPCHLRVCARVLAPTCALGQARHRNAKEDELWLAAIRTEQRVGSTKAAEALLAKALQVRARGGGGGASVRACCCH